LQWRGQGAEPLAFSWGCKGDILFREREYPLCPCRPQAAYPFAPVRKAENRYIFSVKMQNFCLQTPFSVL
jgi:hypothetical protein